MSPPSVAAHVAPELYRGSEPTTWYRYENNLDPVGVHVHVPGRLLPVLALGRIIPPKNLSPRAPRRTAPYYMYVCHYRVVLSSYCSPYSYTSIYIYS